MVIYLDGILLISQKLEELLMGRDTITFPLTQSGFVITLKKSILAPVQQTEFPDLEIDYVEFKLFLPQREVEEIFLSQNAMEDRSTLSDLAKLLGKLSSTIQAILTAKLQISFL